LIDTALEVVPSARRCINMGKRLKMHAVRFFCIAGVFSVARKKGAVCMFKNVANPRLHLAISTGQLYGAVCDASVSSVVQLVIHCYLSLFVP